MKKIRSSTCVVLACFCLLLTSKASGQLTWSSFVEALGPGGSYDPSQPATSNVVSRFTPAKAIKVTRVEVQAAQGSQEFIFNPPSVVACTVPLAFTVTDGSNSFTLPLPSAATVVTGGNNPSSADSGKLSLGFPAGAKIVIEAVLGDPSGTNTGGCVASEINITVQYEIRAAGENEQ